VNVSWLKLGQRKKKHQNWEKLRKKANPDSTGMVVKEKGIGSNQETEEKTDKENEKEKYEEKMKKNGEEKGSKEKDQTHKEVEDEGVG